MKSASRCLTFRYWNWTALRSASLRRLFDISVSLSDGADKLGMRPGAEGLMKQNAGHIKNVYALLRDRTGITIPEIEVLLSSLC